MFLIHILVLVEKLCTGLLTENTKIINKQWHYWTQSCIHDVECYTAIKRDEIELWVHTGKYCSMFLKEWNKASCQRVYDRYKYTYSLQICPPMIIYEYA